MEVQEYKKVVQINHEEKVDVQMRRLKLERDKRIQKIHDLQKEVGALTEAIQKCKEQWDKRTLIASPHAIMRFKERIVNMPEKAIRKMLTSPELNAAYVKYGAGKYKIPEAPDALVVIRDFAVVTVINKNTAEEKLRVLPYFMEYLIEQKINKALGMDVMAMNFSQFRRAYYRNHLQNVK